MMRAFLVSLFLVVAAGAARADLSGPVVVINGDTLEVGGVHIGLYGIDAPEDDQVCYTKDEKPYDCGLVATRTLNVLAGGRVVTCEGRGPDQTGRIGAVCFLGRTDLGEQMVAQGWAMAVPGRGAAYEPAQKAARKMGDGMWKGKFDPPWKWRGDRGLAAAEGIPAGSFVCISGRREAGGAECPRYRADDGTLYSLLGDNTGIPANQPVCLCGTVGSVSFCMEGTPFTVSRIGGPSDCDSGAPEGPREADPASK